MYIILFAAGIKAGGEEWPERIADVMIAPWMWIDGTGASFTGASFGIYLMHAMVIIPLAIAMHSLPLHPALKWIMLSVSGVCLR